jgi:micrococcal nuclease
MYEYKFNLLRVVDGDTVDVDIDLGFGIWMRKQRIRLNGVDTPESRTRDLEEKKFGLLAKEKLIQLLANSRVIRTFEDEKGKFGRVLGDFEVYHEDRWCSAVEVLIKEHYGVKYHGQSKEDIVEGHLENRKHLMGAGIGIST